MSGSDSSPTPNVCGSKWLKIIPMIPHPRITSSKSSASSPSRRAAVANLKVRVTPESSREEVQYSDGVARVWVRAAPADGEANDALCRVLDKHIGVPNTSLY